MVKYNGLTKAEVLCALYNNAKCQGLGFLQFEHGNMQIAEAEKFWQDNLILIISKEEL